MDSNTEAIIVDNNACNDRSLTVLNLTRFVNLRVFEVGNYSFSYVDEVYLIGLPKLERVLIGVNSFSETKGDWGSYTTNHFHLKDCESVKELKIGRYSFKDYSVVEIENVDSLEVIEMGVLNNWSSNFMYASLELKSECD